MNTETHIIIQEALINSPNINSNDELIFKLRIKSGDWTNELKDLIWNCKDTGTPLSIVMKPFQPTEDRVGDYIQTISSKRQKLAYLMEKYCEKETTDIELEKQKLYTKYGITTRSQLNEIQLDNLIASYEAGLNYNI